MGKDEGCLLIVMIIAIILAAIAFFIKPDEGEWQRPDPTVYESTK